MKYPWPPAPEDVQAEHGGEGERLASPLDGIALAAKKKAELAARVDALKERGTVPGLGTILVGDDPGSQIYVGAKHRDCKEVGIASIDVRLPAHATQDEVMDAVAALNADPACTAFIVQLPLPSHLNTAAVLHAMDPKKDADGLHPVNLGLLVEDINGTSKSPAPCTPKGIVELLQANDIPPRGARVCVLGRGLTTGRPLGLMLTQRDVGATAILCHTATKDVASELRAADVIIAAAGVPSVVKPEDVKPGAAVIDVGVSRVDGKIAGDVAPGVEKVAGWLSPNPGGVGPMTRVMLLENVVNQAEAALS